MAREIKPLTGLRFLAALAVFTCHAENRTALAQFGMTLFFCLSGYVLTTAYGDTRDWRRFAWSRFTRIYPLFFVLFAFSIPTAPGPLTQLPAHLLLIQAWTGDVWSYYPASWSLSVEFALYLSFPLIALCLPRIDRRLALATCLLAPFAVASLIALRLPVTRTTDPGTFWLYFFPLARLPDFLVGCLLARSRSHERYGPAGLIALVALMIIGPDGGFAWDALWLAPVALLIAGLACERGHLAALLSTRTLVLLGRASFAFYLIQGFVLEDFPRPLTPLTYLAAFAVTTAVAIALHLRVEVPLRASLRGLFRDEAHAEHRRLAAKRLNIERAGRVLVDN